MTILRKPIKRELPERIARRQMIVELHPSFIRFREKRSRTAWDISWESVYWNAAEIRLDIGVPTAFSATTGEPRGCESPRLPGLPAVSRGGAHCHK